MMVKPDEIVARDYSHSSWTAQILQQDTLSKGYVHGFYMGFEGYGRTKPYFLAPSNAKEKITVLEGDLYVRRSLGGFCISLKRGEHRILPSFTLYRLESHSLYDSIIFKREFNLDDGDFSKFELNDIHFDRAFVKFTNLQSLLLRQSNPTISTIQKALEKIER